jgi:amino-acid N-acetyltransferase
VVRGILIFREEKVSDIATRVSYRPATVRDVEGIFRLINRMAQAGLMLRRSKYRIVTMLSSFIVAEVAGNAEDSVLVGCGAVFPLWTDSAEIVALAVDERFQGSRVGKSLVEELLSRARAQGFPEVITLTYEVEFFRRLGFTAQPRDKFPRKLWRECLECPRLEDCDETAMSIRLDGVPPTGIL